MAPKGTIRDQPLTFCSLFHWGSEWAELRDQNVTSKHCRVLTGQEFDECDSRQKPDIRLKKTPRQRPVVSSSCSSWFIYPIAISQKVLRWMNSEVQMFLSLAADENIKPELDGMLRNVHIFANRIWMNKIVKQNLLKCDDSLIDWVCHCSKASDGNCALWLSFQKIHATHTGQHICTCFSVAWIYFCCGSASYTF